MKDYISFATVPSTTINIMAVHKYSLKEYKKTKEAKLSKMACFKFSEINHQKFIAFKHLVSGKYIKSLNNGTVILSDDKLIPENKFLISGNFRSFDEETGELKKITLGTKKNTFLGKTNINLINAKETAVSKDTLMHIVFNGSTWNIMNQDRFLSSKDNKTLSFELDKPLLTAEKRNKKNKITQVAVYGASLDNQKNFQIQEFFMPI